MTHPALLELGRILARAMVKEFLAEQLITDPDHVSPYTEENNNEKGRPLRNRKAAKERTQRNEKPTPRPARSKAGF